MCFHVPPGPTDIHHGHWGWDKIHDCHVWPPAGAAEAEHPQLCQLHHWPVRGHLVRSGGPLSGEAQSEQPTAWPAGGGGVSGKAHPPQVRVTRDTWAALPLTTV